MEIAPSSVGKEAPLLLKLLQKERSFDLGNCQGASEHVLVCLPILWLTSESSTILHGISGRPVTRTTHIQAWLFPLWIVMLTFLQQAILPGKMETAPDMNWKFVKTS